MAVVNLHEYKINKLFKQISSIINQIVQLKILIKTHTTGYKINYQDYLINLPSGVDSRLLNLLMDQQKQRVEILVDMKKRENNLKNLLRQVSRELGNTCQMKVVETHREYAER